MHAELRSEPAHPHDDAQPSEEAANICALERAVEADEIDLCDRWSSARDRARELGQRLQDAQARASEPDARARAQEICDEVLGTTLPAVEAETIRIKSLRVRAAAVAQRTQLNDATRAVLSAVDLAMSNAVTLFEELDEILARVPPPAEPGPEAPDDVEPEADDQEAEASAGPDVSPRERRVHPRVPFRTQVTLHSESNFYNGFSDDISEGGIFVATYDVVSRGTTVDLTLTLEDREIAISGEVRWIREYDEMNPSIQPGMGIQFAGLTDEQRQIIDQFLQQRQADFYC